MTIKTFTDILALRGRVVIFTPNAPVGLRFEQHAERHHAQVITTRGWADRLAPMSIWQRLHVNREYGLLSCDQHTYTHRIHIPATDLVWVGSVGDAVNEIALSERYHQAMSRASHLEIMGHQVRKWLIGENDL